MTTFATIRKAAEERVGKAALARRLPKVKSAAALRRVSDDRYLSLMSLRIFRAGLRHDMVDAKWPAFEKVFRGFEPRKVRSMSDEQVEALMGDARVIRHLGKLKAVHANAAAMVELASEKGSCGAYLADWPGDQMVALWEDLAKRFHQMGGNSGAYFLRMAGKDTFILSYSVVKALQHWRFFKGEPKGKRDRAAVQVLFNEWTEETGLPLAHLSIILAVSLD
jgi:3-methyladenine DNA glycosylase Tag